MKKILIAGASGQLGRHVVQQLQQHGVMVRALARDASKLSGLGIDGVVNGDLTMAETLRGCCDGMDAVISCAGASMNLNDFRDRKSFYEVDYRGNLNLLDEAKRANIVKFVYISLAGGDRLRHTEYGDAHEKFVAALQASEIRHTVVRPTGFFGFNLELLKFAAKGLGLVIGKGDCKTNPIHEADVATACVKALESEMSEISIGGPQVFTRKETVEMAFAALDRPAKLISISPKLFKLMISPLRIINRRVYALMDFGIAVTQTDSVAPSFGSHTLRSYFDEAAKTI
ncbi:MAG: SDR family oxidoreductase [Acidobacteriota bacterium]|nr:SDR family oxidoreductase [Acidobacteriota bacterium]